MQSLDCNLFCVCPACIQGSADYGSADFRVSGFSRWADVVSGIECGQPEHEEFYIADTPELRSECLYRVPASFLVLSYCQDKSRYFLYCVQDKTPNEQIIYFVKYFFASVIGKAESAGLHCKILYIRRVCEQKSLFVWKMNRLFR